MATYTVDANDNGVGAWTTTAGTVDTVTFGANVQRVRIISDGAAEGVAVIDGGTLTAMPAAGASTRALRLPAGGMSVLEVSMDGSTDSVKILTAGTVKVSVEKAL